jgi:hypothetical protein
MSIARSNSTDDEVEDDDDDDIEDELERLRTVLENDSKLPENTRNQIKQLTKKCLVDISNILNSWMITTACINKTNTRIIDNTIDNNDDEDGGGGSQELQELKEQVKTVVNVLPDSLSDRNRYEHHLHGRSDRIDLFTPSRRYPVLAACGKYKKTNSNDDWMSSSDDDSDSDDDGGNDNADNENRRRPRGPSDSNRLWECNENAVQLVPLLAELGIKYTTPKHVLFPKETLLKFLLRSSRTSSKKDNRLHQTLVDERYLDALKELERIDLFTKEDVRRFDLLDEWFNWNCKGMISNPNTLRFEFLVNMNPNCLKAEPRGRCSVTIRRSQSISVQHRSHIDTMLHSTTGKSFSSIYGFEAVLKAGIYHFPNEFGFLFHRNYSRDNFVTPYQLACTKFGKKKVSDVVLKICFARQKQQQEQKGDDDDDEQSSVTLPSTKSFILAVTDQTIHLDSIYVQLCRNPALIQQLSSSSKIFEGEDDGDDDDVDVDVDVDVDDDDDDDKFSQE